jgi:hypothetical protein
MSEYASEAVREKREREKWLHLYAEEDSVDPISLAGTSIRVTCIHAHNKIRMEKIDKRKKASQII